VTAETTPTPPWAPWSRGELRAQQAAVAAKCCGNDEWRGYLCEYHLGWAAGYDQREDEANQAARLLGTS
jgi:hypothetical protein